jgi:ABC-type transport system substrate-binding protein
MRFNKVRVALPLAFLCAAVSPSMGDSSMAKPLRYWFLTPPKTFDTFEADLFDVMQVAKNIYAPLVSTFIDGTPQGMIAEDWQVDKSGKVWRFRIKKGLKFEDGTPITPEAVLENFRRILWLTKDDGLALNSLLPGVKERKQYGDPIPGLRVEGDALVFEFSRRPGNLFELVEQPVYGIANPKCFGANGEWIKPFCSAESGAYRVKSISPEKVVLESRHAYPAVADAPETVEILTLALNDNFVNTLTEGRGDIALTPRFAISRETISEMGGRGVKLLEAPPTEMHFVQLNASRAPFNDKALRQSVRDVFLDLLRRNHDYSAESSIDASFIPRGGIGYRSFLPPTAPHARIKNHVPVDVLLFPVARYPSPRDRKIQDALEASLLDSLRQHGLEPRVSRFDDRSPAIQRLRNGDFDVIVRFTGILVDDPFADLRMMFMSKVGALIPDPSGTIPGLIEKAEVSSDPDERRKLVERINTSVYDEASIVTFAHSGLVYLHNASVDLSRVNLFTDPIEFRAVGWKPK